MKRNEKHVQPGSQKLLNNKGMQDQNRPVTSKELEDLLKLPPEEAIEKLLQHKSRYQLLVQKQELPDEVLKFLVQILVLAAAPGFRRENLHELFLMTCEKQFFNRLCSFVMRMKRKQPEKCHGFLNGLVTVLQAYAEAMTSVALERLPNLIDICLTVLPITADAGLMQKYEDLQNFLMEEKKKWHRGGFDRRTRGNISDWDDAEPPEDFREVPSFPTCKELLQRQQPFLRRNITEGSYKDDNHYLDVQFRLLREDFVRPLRNGINDFKEAVRNRDIRVYKGVTISRPVIKQGEILHVAHVKLPKHVNFEKSKRLMHESLLCLSNDGFQTLLCGTVANTDDLANEGRLEIKFKSNLRMEDLKGIFVMIECKAYFMAYKYVLQGLKDLADGVPFASYIVHVTSDVDPPEYLNEDTLYDLRVVKDLKLIRESHAGRIVPMSLLRRSRKSTLWGKNKNDPDPEASPLYNVPVTSELDAWPSSEELSLDDSQRRALHSALTRCFAIIQGPPGTGKTFIGLKITQILLHNRDIWNSEDNPNPILIISFTNHALDQFLEEISKCTNNIVRVGSRTKSEIIKRFQIKEVTRSLRRTINSEREYWIRNNITHAANLMEKLQNTSEEYESPSGIISMNVLSEVIPIHFLFQLQNMKGNLSLWLLDHRLLGQASMHTKRQTRPFKASLKKAPNEARSNSLHYEVTLDFLEKQSEPPANKSNFFAQRNSQIQANRREMLQTGLQIPEDPVKSMELEQTGSNIWRLEITTRWQLYKHWVRKAQFQVLNELSLTKDNCRKLNEDLQNVRNELSLHAMKQASIVGMTTTTAARQAKVLKELAPSLGKIYAPTLTHSHSYTFTLTHLLKHSHSYSLIHSLTHSFTHSLTH
ncbi:NFX1-type zinc finger-containing protein 1-like, partial [Penaeus japonicus]|uniref:NFX1-type zinc finger-containing protein 1-like n=1 Tax=Penaeus japonicus TaxID=27405 RepID=UPI001C70EE53